jgi:triosephosphate isomerase
VEQVRKPFIAGNWKMFKTAAETTAFMRELSSAELARDVDAVLCAPFVDLPALVAAAQGTTVGVGAQNMHWEASGAFTGEVSGEMLTALGVQYVIIGHSERRAYFAETDETVNKKVLAALARGLTPILCVGEELAVRENGAAEQWVTAQVAAAVRGVAAAAAARLVIAYEPIWAIGTGRTATAADAQGMSAAIRGACAAVFGADGAEAVRVLYGGSVKPENISSFMAKPDIDGALVGGASLTAASFGALTRGASKE